MFIGIYTYIYILIFSMTLFDVECVTYGVATISRLLKNKVSFAKEPYKRDDILQKRPIILRSQRIVATPYLITWRITYVVATISRLLEIIGLFCRI